MSNRIAIYHGFHHIHFEMLGYLFEYFKLNNILSEVSIYSHINIFSFEWWTYYKKLFDLDLIWHDPIIFNPDNYEFVFLVTDDDITFINNNKIKVIAIEHIDYIRRDSVYKRIGTRFFINRPSCDWALPCFTAISKKDKFKILDEQDKINICIIGKNQPKNLNILKLLFENFNDINFHLVVREYDYDIKNVEKNIFLYINELTSIMINLLEKSHFVLCFDAIDDDHYQHKSISGALHLGLSFGCKLIIPQIWNNFYNFKSCLPYLSDSGCKYYLDKNTNLDLIYNEQYELIHHRNNLFDKIISFSPKI